MADVTTVIMEPLPPDDDVPHHLIAVTADDAVRAQQSMGAWCDERLRVLRAEVADTEKNYAHAVAHKWKAGPFLAAKKRLVMKVEFYEKLAAAIDAGYVLVPNLPVDVFAIRTTKNHPKHVSSRWANELQQKSNLPALGEGDYVSDMPGTYSFNKEFQNKDGTTRTEPYLRAFGWSEIGFPASLVKPQVLTRTQEAMARRVFDTVGLVGSPKSDPIVVGQIFDKTRPYRDKLATFLIAWFLDLRTL